MCSLPKVQSMLSRETIQNAFFFSELCPFFDLHTLAPTCDALVYLPDVDSSLIYNPFCLNCFPQKEGITLPQTINF